MSKSKTTSRQTEAGSGDPVVAPYLGLPVASMCERRLQLPRELIDILSRTLSKSSQRHQTGAEIAADLRSIRAVLPVSTDSGVAPPPMSDPDRLKANESAMLATVVTPAPISSPLPATASSDIRL